MKHKNFKFIKCDISDSEELNRIFNEYKIDKVINLVAQAGVRYSVENTNIYINTNIKDVLDKYTKWYKKYYIEKR